MRINDRLTSREVDAKGKQGSLLKSGESASSPFVRTLGKRQTELLSYEQELQQLFRTSAFPTFDLICLGLGDNGHTASLFPGTVSLREKEHWILPQYVEVMTSWRVTFTAPLINAARNSAFLAEGAGKAEVLWRSLNGPYQPDVLPAQLIQPVNGELHWLVDAAAAAKLQSSLPASRPARRRFADTA